MDCRTTSTNARAGGYSLAELLVAIGITGIVLTAVAQLMAFSGRSMVSMFNYADLDNDSNTALKVMSRDIRQARNVAEVTENSLTLNDYDGKPLKYSWSAETQELARTKEGTRYVLLRGCESVKFALYQRNPIGGSYNQHEAAGADTAKLVQVQWACSRKVLGFKMNTASVQSARFVIRKQ